MLMPVMRTFEDLQMQQHRLAAQSGGACVWFDDRMVPTAGLGPAGFQSPGADGFGPKFGPHRFLPSFHHLKNFGSIPQFPVFFPPFLNQAGGNPIPFPIKIKKTPSPADPVSPISTGTTPAELTPSPSNFDQPTETTSRKTCRIFRPWDDSSIPDSEAADPTPKPNSLSPQATKLNSDPGRRSSSSRNSAVVSIQDHQQSALELLATNLGKFTNGHRCIYCSKVYSRKYGLKIHLRTHTGFKPLKCRVCHRAFGDPSNLNKHTRLHAENGLAFKCHFCGKLLVRKRDLDRHLASRHDVKLEGEGVERKAEITTIFSGVSNEFHSEKTVLSELSENDEEIDAPEEIVPVHVTEL